MRPSLVLTLAVAAFMMSTLPSVDAQTNEKIDYQIFIDCPQSRTVRAGSVGACPIQAVDGQDMMGSPSVAVDIKNPNNLILASLHGDDGNGPSRRSRAGQVFTTFASTNHGALWNDRPYFPPPGVGTGAFGEHPQVVNDPYGHVYVGSLYARSTGGSGPSATYEYVLAAQKFENVQKVLSSQGGFGTYNVQFLDPYFDRNAITQFWYIFDPHADNMTIVWHERPQKPGSGSASDKAPTHVIGYAWTTMKMKSKYLYAPNEYLIGPCSTSTNPVWSEGYVYVGCVVDLNISKFPWNPRTITGRVELFRFKLDGEPPQYLGPSPVVGGLPKLGVRSDGRIALFSTTPDAAGKPQLVGAFGKYKGGRIDWNELINYSPKIPKLRVDERILESNIQDLEYREYSGAVHLILKERVRYDSLVSVDNPLAAVGAPQFRKTLVAIDEEYGWLAHYNFDIGNLNNRTDPELAAADEMNYDDLSDDIIQLPPKNFTWTMPDGQKKLLGEDYAREFVAVGDYGIIQFAEIMEITNLRPPAPGPEQLPAAALAAPSLAIQPAVVVVPIAGTAFAGLLAFALIANRRKNPLAAYTKGEK